MVIVFPTPYAHPPSTISIDVIVFAAETKTLAVACLPSMDPFISSAECMVVVTPEELLYPDPGFTIVNSLIELKL